jgi:hypothetical protein
MVVRIRIRTGQRIDGLYAGFAGFLTLASVACFSLSAWKLLADLGWAGNFVWDRGIPSHWQVWMAGAVAAQLVSFRLARKLPLIS